jgi:hypothetical protein
MDRIKILLAAALIIASVLTFTTCDNPIDMLGELEVKVMQANNRYLEVEGIRALSILSDNSVSPGTTIEIVFDRAFNPDSAVSALSVTSSLGTPVTVVIDTLAPSNILRFKASPYFVNNSDYVLSLSGVMGSDGSSMLGALSWNFRTGIAPVGFLTLITKDSDALKGYARTVTVSAAVEANELVSKYILSDSAAALEPPPDDGPEWLSVTGAASGDWTLPDQTQGVRTVYARFRQYTGSGYVYSEIVSANIHFDNVPPVVSSIANTYSGSSQSYLKSGSYTFTASVTNSGTSPSPLRYVWFYKDTTSGAALVNYVAEDTTANYQWSWNTSSDADGSYYIKAIARDSAGNWSAANYNNTRYVDKTPPAFTSFVLNSGSTYATSTAVTASISVSGAHEMYFNLYTYTGSSWRNDGATPYTAYASSYPLTLAVDDQSKLVYLYARDQAGNFALNSGSTPYDTIILDTTPPTAPSVSVTTGFYDTTPTWSWSARGGGNGTFEYILDRGTPVQTSATSFTPASALSEDIHTFTVKERDAAGNWSSATAAGVRITQVLPYQGQTGVSRTPLLEWWAYPLALSFDVQYKDGLNWVTWTNTTRRYYQVLSTLPSMTSIAWRVAARDKYNVIGYIPSSAGASFTTGK